MTPALAAEMADEHIAWLRATGAGPEPAWGPGMSLERLRPAIVLCLIELDWQHFDGSALEVHPHIAGENSSVRLAA